MNIIETIESSISPAQVGSLARTLGETPDATQKAMAGAVPALLGGFAHQGETQQGAARLIDMMKGLPLFGSIGELFGVKNDRLTQSGAQIVNQLFNGSSSGVTEQIARFSGMKGASVQNLLAMAAPMVLGGLAKQAPPGGFSPQGLMGFFEGQRRNIANALPAGLSGLAGLLGLSSLGRATSATASRTTQTVARTAERSTSGIGRILPWLLGAAILGLLLLFGMRSCSTETAAPTSNVSLSLPGGGTVDVRAGSIDEQLFRFLSGSTPAPKTFTFDYLDFDTGLATYTASSQPTIDGMAAILNAYPTAVVRVEGFTDSEGDDASNLALSQARADTVAQALVARGVAASRVSAVGVGEARPVGDNNTEAGRAKNRRIELVVTQR